MTSDRRRAALIACCVLAVVVAGSLFPAAGYGDYPTSDAVGSDFYDGGPADGVNDGSTDDGIEADDEADDEVADEGNEELDEGDEPDAGEGESETEEEDEPDGQPESGAEDRDEGESDADESQVPVFGLLFLGGLVSVVVLFWRLSDPTRSSDVSADDLPSGFVRRLRFRLRLGLHRIPQVTMAATIGVSRVVPSVLDATTNAARGVGSGLGLVARDLGRGVGTSIRTIPSVLSRPGSGGLFSLAGGVPSLFTSLRSNARSKSRGSRSSANAPSTPAHQEPEPDLGPKTIEGAWEAMIDDLPVRRPRARTPGEYARRAVDAGLPERAVGELTDAFRDVRYGGFPPSPDRTRSARSAFEEIQHARARDDHDGNANQPRDSGGSRP